MWTGAQGGGVGGGAPPWQGNCVAGASHRPQYTCITACVRLTSPSAICMNICKQCCGSSAPPERRRTYRGHCSAHPDGTKVVGVQVLVAVEADARGSESHAGPRGELESPSGHVPRPCSRKAEKGEQLKGFIRSQIQIRALPLNRLYDFGVIFSTSLHPRCLICETWWYLPQKLLGKHFLGCPVVKNLPANAGNKGSIPSPGMLHSEGQLKPMRHNHQACDLEPQLLSPHATTRESSCTVMKT